MDANHQDEKKYQRFYSQMYSNSELQNQLKIFHKIIVIFGVKIAKNENLILAQKFQELRIKVRNSKNKNII